VHIGTQRCTAHVALLQDSAIEPGTEVAAQLVLDAPVFALPGDRLILRNAQASRTIAGGMALDPDAPARKRRSPERMAYLQAIETLIATGSPAALVSHAGHGISLAKLQRLSGRLLDQLQLPGTQRIAQPDG